MTVSFNGRLPSLTISNGTTVSGNMKSNDIFDAVAIIVGSPSGLEANTYIFEVSPDDGTTFYTLQDNGGNALGPGQAGTLRVFTELVGLTFRIRSSAAVGADRVFQIHKIFTT